MRDSLNNNLRICELSPHFLTPRLEMCSCLALWKGQPRPLLKIKEEPSAWIWPFRVLIIWPLLKHKITTKISPVGLLNRCGNELRIPLRQQVTSSLIMQHQHMQRGCPMIWLHDHRPATNSLIRWVISRYLQRSSSISSSLRKFKSQSKPYDDDPSQLSKANSSNFQPNNGNNSARCSPQLP